MNSINFSPLANPHTYTMSSRFETSLPFHTHKKRVKTPSFSSILLDAVYRSIDEDGGDYPRTTPTSPTHNIMKQRDFEIDASKLVQRRTKMRSDSTLETLDLRRAVMIESWMEKHPNPNPNHQQQQTLQSQPQKKHFLGDVLDQKVRIIRQKSVPASSHNNVSSSSLCFTNLAQRSSRDQSSSRIFTKTKSRALKIYGDLKKSKNQNTPISPGRRIAAFLNSIFRNNNNSLAKTSPEYPKPPISTTTTSNSTCSTASSFSRSCLSNKTSSSSSSKSTPASTTTKRSVRFYPVSVILDEDSRPCGHKSLHKINENERFKKLVSPRPVNSGDGVERQKWRREKEIDALMMMIKANCGDTARNRHVSRFEEGFDREEIEEDDDNDDDGSCASSDLFELENLSSVGVVSRYCEELPVYGTTSLKNLTA